MDRRDVFKIWAPLGAKWVDWVRPVPFIEINNEFKNYEYSDFINLNINYINEIHKDTAIIVDLPGNNSINEGLALAKIGYRPIPIYNGTNEQEGAMPTTDNREIQKGLFYGAMELKKMELSIDASPVFLLDKNRTNRFKMDNSVFDNSWDIYDQDMPSVEYFLKNGIKKIIVRGAFVQKDLRVILYKFQKKGIQIFLTNGYEKPSRIIIRRFFWQKKFD